MLWFAYFWNVNPDASRLVGPFDTELIALDHIAEDESGDSAGIMELPFRLVRE